MLADEDKASALIAFLEIDFAVEVNINKEFFIACIYLMG